LAVKEIVLGAIAKNEKVVVASYYGQTLDLLSGFLNEWGVPFLRLDGKVVNKKR
jgi:SNF2 family DNA or RNA helicase